MWRERAEEQVQLALVKVADSQAGMGWAPAHNLLARMAEADGKIDIAVMEWRASLAATEDQPHVWRRLGEALLSFDDQSSTDEGWLALQRAALEGESKACFRLAERHHQAGELSDARRLLSLGFAQSVLEGGTDTPDEVKAATLWAAVAEPPTELVPKSNRLTIFVAIAVALGLSLVFLVQRRGKTLQELVQIAPECAHDLARLLSAIRHEVLKHNTNLLEEVARALEAGDDDAHRRVSFAARQLFGDDETEEGGVIARFYGDLGAIERLALQYGVRVDLRRRDSVLAPMASAMEELMRLAPDLRRPQKARAHVPKLLRALSVRLNEDGYQALGQMVRKISAVDITEIVVRDADARVRAEPDLANKTLPTLHVNVHEEDGISARVSRADLDDILANLLRNAYSALVSGPPQEDPAVWVEVGREVDSSPESFERVVIRVWDTAEGLVTTDMIQRQPIERGLGLVFDLVRRHDGTISVDEGTEDTQTATSRWKKSIVVRLLRVETHIGASQAVTPVTVEEELLGEDQQIKVLVVEDGHEYSTNLRRFLSEYFRFERAGDGFEALSALEQTTWDVVFLDMRFDRAERLMGDPKPLTERFGGDLERARRLLEDNQGTHILEAIRAAGNYVPVLFSYDFDGEPRRYRNLEQRYGPLGYLPDTAGPAEIRAALNALAKAVG